MQTADVAEVAGAAGGFSTLCVFGGVSKGDQLKTLRQSDVQLLVATPGRLLDLVQTESSALTLARVNYLVLDEADRMLDKGFEEAIRSIIGMCQPLATRQTALFSATWPDAIRQLASEFLDDPVRITIGSEDLTANVRVKQIVEVLEQFQKEKRLLQLLTEYHRPVKGELNRILIFALYKKEADRIEQLLKRNGWACDSIHGDKSQDARTAALAKFKSGATQLLIATDVAARGLDIPDVKYVVNVTFPLTIEDYIHRIGRTGRAGKLGISHTLFTSNDKSHAGGLANVLREAEQPVPEDLIKFGVFTKKKEHGMYGAHFKDVDMNAKAKKVTFD
jgi:ATP-dependent RNA helicase DBP3